MKRTAIFTLIVVVCFAGGIGAQEALTVAPNGNVGINNANPDAQLDVTGDVDVVGNSEFIGNLEVTGAVTTNGPMTVNGTITTTTAIAAPNLVFTETVLLAQNTDGTDIVSPAAGSDLAIALPNGYTGQNSFIVSAKLLGPDGVTWVQLPHVGNATHGNVRALRTYLNANEIQISNRWNNETYTGRPVQVILARVGPPLP